MTTVSAALRRPSNLYDRNKNSGKIRRKRAVAFTFDLAVLMVTSLLVRTSATSIGHYNGRKTIVGFVCSGGSARHPVTKQLGPAPPTCSQPYLCSRSSSTSSGGRGGYFTRLWGTVQDQINGNHTPVSQIEDDGFIVTGGSWMHKISRTLNPLLRREPGTLIMIRHGESMLNYNKTFTGWVDADLNERGIRETEHAARLLLERGYEVDVTYTSRLKRAIRSSWILMTELNQIYRPVFKSWRLNERMYGALEGMSKPGLAKELGEEVVQSFRTGLTARPPPMLPDHPHWHAGEKKYRDLKPEEIPVTESLQDTMERTLPLWETRILPDLQSGRTVMIVAHANSLRGIVKHIDNLNPDEIQTVAIPNGIPLVYKFDRNMKPIKQEGAVHPLSGEFLEKKGLLRAALAREMELAASVPGYSSPTTGNTETLPPVVLDARLRSLAKLSEARKMIEQATGPLSGEAAAPNVSKSRFRVSSPPRSPIVRPQSQPQQQQAAAAIRQSAKGNPNIKDPIVVIIRHGKTEYNKLGVFTGWEDAPLANEGRVEARRAGKLLKRHGIEFDIVYTSWLSRGE